jgi:hypothetical protein
MQFEHWQVVQFFGLSPLGALTIQQVKKGFESLKIKNQNWITNYVLPFKAMVIMESCSYERQGIQTYNPFDDILNLNFD